jgi:hypothetical protein
MEASNERLIGDLDARIRTLEAELQELRRERLARTPPPPLSTLPPPRVPTPPQHPRSFLTGAQAVLTLGAIALIAAVASFAGFVWPHLTLELRALALGALVLALGAGAVFSKTRLVSVSEALAASAAASLTVLALWWYLETADSATALGVGAALAVSATPTVAAALRFKLQSWVWFGSATSTLSLAALITDSSPLELTSLACATAFAFLAWKLRWWQFVWSSGLFVLGFLAALTDRVSQTSLPVTIAFAGFICACALLRDSTPRVPRELQPAVKHTGIALFAVSTYVALSSCLAVLTEPDFTSRSAATLSALSLALFAHRILKLRAHRSALLALALVCASAGLAPVWLLAALCIALLVRRNIPAVVLFSVGVALTAVLEVDPGVITGDSPRWFAFAVAAVLPAVACITAKRPELAALTGLTLSAALLALIQTGEPELRAIPVGIVLALCWLLARAQDSNVTTWWLIPAPAVALAPSTLLALGATSELALQRTSGVLVAATLLILIGSTRRLAGALLPGATALTLVLLARLTDVVSEVPLWLPLVLAAIVLLAAGARFEALENRGRRTVRWLQDLR